MIKPPVSILVVDDEEVIRRMIARALKRVAPDAQMAEASSGFQAGYKLIELHPHLIVLDLNLPGVDGFQVCQFIKSDPQFDGTKVLAVTGLGIDEARTKILAAGADDFLAKPFETAILIEKLGQLLSVGRHGYSSGNYGQDL